MNIRYNIAELWKWVKYLRAHQGGGGGGTITSVNGQTGPAVTLTAEDVDAVSTIQPGDNITIDNSDPQNPIISSTGGGGTELTAGSGIRIEDGVVKLGADLLSGSTNGIIEGMTTLAILNNSGGGNSIIFDESVLQITCNNDNPNQNQSGVRVYPLAVAIESSIGGGSNTCGITISAAEINGGMTVYDVVGTKGLVYAGDYSTNGTADNNWIPNWGTVKAAIENAPPPSLNLQSVTDNGAATSNPLIITGGDGSITPNVLQLQKIDGVNGAYISLNDTTLIGIVDEGEQKLISLTVGSNYLQVYDDRINLGNTPISIFPGTETTHAVTLGQLNTGLSSKLTATQGVAVPDTATEAVGETVSKAEFDALLAELRALKASLAGSDIIAT